jgi:hypothetical protein
MGDIRQLRLTRWERIQKAGMLRFVLTRGLAFGILFGVMVCIPSPPPLPWYILMLLFCVAGLAWGAAMWGFTMWQYGRARKNG